MSREKEEGKIIVQHHITSQMTDTDHKNSEKAPPNSAFCVLQWKNEKTTTKCHFSFQLDSLTFNANKYF